MKCHDCIIAISYVFKPAGCLVFLNRNFHCHSLVAPFGKLIGWSEQRADHLPVIASQPDDMRVDHADAETCVDLRADHNSDHGTQELDQPPIGQGDSNFTEPGPVRSQFTAWVHLSVPLQYFQNQALDWWRRPAHESVAGRDRWPMLLHHHQDVGSATPAVGPTDPFCQSLLPARI